MDFITYIEQLKKEQRQINIVELRKNIDHRDVIIKINNFINRWDGLSTLSEIQNRILIDDLVAALFAKDPSKQNISEKAITQLLGNQHKLPSTGQNCIRFNSEGIIVSQAGVGITKSADFIINGRYYTQKYTMDSGGAQDNQYHDVVEFLEKGSQLYQVGAILDGNYWEIHRHEIQQHFREKDVIVTSMNNFKEVSWEI